jgi:hypothetical protein
MRRLVTVAPVAMIAVLLAVAGCTRSGGSTEPSTPRAGNPSDTASPNVVTPPVTSTPPPTDATVSASPSTTPPDLPECLSGTWTAPVAREFGNLAIADRSDGLVRAGTGVLALAITADRKWTFTYRHVTFQLAAGSVDVDGPIDGTWSLDGNLLTETIGTSSVRTTLHLGGASVRAPGAVTSLIQELPPNQVRVECTGGGLQFQLPTAQGAGRATVDRA